MFRLGNNKKEWDEISNDIKSYRWNDGDFLLCSYYKTGNIRFIYEAALPKTHLWQCGIKQ